MNRTHNAIGLGVLLALAMTMPTASADLTGDFTNDALGVLDPVSGTVLPAADFKIEKPEVGLQNMPTVEEANSCPYEDQSGGVGGQAGTCAFNCPGPAGKLTAHIDADDSSAGVSVTGSCSGTEAHCSGRNSCSSTETYTGEGAGTCSGDTDEVTDDGVFISCSADPDEIDDPVTGEYCPVTQPTQVCVQGPPTFASHRKTKPTTFVQTAALLERDHPSWLVFSQAQASTDAVQELCSRSEACDVVGGVLVTDCFVGSSAVHMYVGHGQAAGLLCRPDGSADLFQPVRTVQDGHTIWSN